MPKRKHNNYNSSTKPRSSKKSKTNHDQENIASDVSNVSHDNNVDFLDNIATAMDKRKNHLEQFYDRSNIQSDHLDTSDNESNEFEKMPLYSRKNDQSPTSVEQTVMVRKSCSTLSSNNNAKKNHGLNQSSSTIRKDSSHLLLNYECGKSTVADNTHSCLPSNYLPISGESIDEADDSMQITKHPTPINNTKSSSNQTLNSSKDSSFKMSCDKVKTAYVSKSIISFNTPCAGHNQINTNPSQQSNSFGIDRSIIRLPDVNTQTRDSQISTNKVAHIRTVDILSSKEYRTLEKENQTLKLKNTNLKQALKNLNIKMKKMEQTHMPKPRPSLWNELKLFMDILNETYEGDGRTIHEIASELHLSRSVIEEVKQDAETPDKIAMNVWRAICPTHTDRLYVDSIRNVPKSTLINIYAFSRLCHPTMNFGFKKMRNDIAANIRQSRFYSKSDKDELFDQEVVEDVHSNDQSNIDESEELMVDSQESLINDNSLDNISSDDE